VTGRKWFWCKGEWLVGESGSLMGSLTTDGVHGKGEAAPEQTPCHIITESQHLRIMTSILFRYI
jgi:hypothetical protein